MKKEIFVTEEASGDRVDKFLSEQCEEYSRSFLPVSYTHLTLPTNREV